MNNAILWFEPMTRTLHNEAGAVGIGKVFDLGGKYGTCVCQVTVAAGFAGEIAFEGSVDGKVYVALQGKNVANGEDATGAEDEGVFYFPVVGLDFFRARIVACTAGTVTVRAVATAAVCSQADSSKAVVEALGGLVEALTHFTEANADTGVATGGSDTEIVDETKNWEDDLLKNAVYDVEKADGTHYLGRVLSNTANTVEISGLPPGVEVEAGDFYKIKMALSSQNIERIGNTVQTGADWTPLLQAAATEDTTEAVLDRVSGLDTEAPALVEILTEADATLIDRPGAEILTFEGWDTARLLSEWTPMFETDPSPFEIEEDETAIGGTKIVCPYRDFERLPPQVAVLAHDTEDTENSISVRTYGKMSNHVTNPLFLRISSNPVMGEDLHGFIVSASAPYGDTWIYISCVPLVFMGDGGMASFQFGHDMDGHDYTIVATAVNVDGRGQDSDGHVTVFVKIRDLDAKREFFFLHTFDLSGLPAPTMQGLQTSPLHGILAGGENNWEALTFGIGEEAPEWDGGGGDCLLVFDEPVTHLRILHAEAEAQTFVANGLNLIIEAGDNTIRRVGGTPSAEVVIPAGVECAVGRYADYLPPTLRSIDEKLTDVEGLPTALSDIDSKLGDIKTEATGIGINTVGLPTDLGAVKTALADIIEALEALPDDLGDIDVKLGDIIVDIGATETLLEAIDTSTSGLPTALSGIDTKLQGIDTKIQSAVTALGGLGPQAEAKTLKISNGETQSGELDLAEFLIINGLAPSTWTEGDLTVEISFSTAVGAGYYELKEIPQEDVANTLLLDDVEMLLVAAASKLRLVSSTAVSAERKFAFMIKG